MNSITENVYRQIIKHNMISDGDKVLLGLSGGADSIFLIHMLKIMQDYFSFEIGAAHVNHSIRGDEAYRDQEFCRHICDSLSIPFHTVTIDIPAISKKRKISEECAGREERYKYFEKLCCDFKYNKIAVAHNMNDSIETLLINIIRGCSLNGLGGIRPVNNNVIRPILSIERKDIESYLNSQSIPYCNDSTNDENIYTRNKIRNIILTEMKKINPSVISTMFSNLETLRDDDDFINQIAEATDAITMSDGKVYIDRKTLDKQHISIQKRIIYDAFKKLKGDSRDIEQKHIEILLQKHPSGKSFDMPGSITVKTEFDKLVFESEKVVTHDFLHQIIPDATIELASGLKCNFELVTTVSEFEQGVLFIDYDKISEQNLYIRNRKDGDKFIPQGMNGFKKIKQFFIEQKIPTDKRNTIPILCSGDEIVAIVPYRISEKYKITDTTKQILRIQMIKEKSDK